MKKIPYIGKKLLPVARSGILNNTNIDIIPVTSGFQPSAATNVIMPSNASGTGVQERDSNIELFRIVAMFAIVAHHYVVNSGLSKIIINNPLSANSIFLLFFGCMGKIGINCFLMITGYFMCTSKMTVRKVLKLFIKIEFYKIAMTSLLLLCGYKQYYNFKILFRMLTPFYDIGKYFTSSIVPFFLLIPYLNIVIHSIDKKTHWKLIGGCLFIFTVLPSIVAPPVFLPINMRFGDICWFTVIYLIAAYIRLYPEPWFENRKLWFCALLASVILAWSSIAGLAVIISSPQRVGAFWHLYFFVADSNKILAVTTSICAFMFFKNLRIGQSKFINTVSASAFGVLLIHAASGVHRLIWDFLNCTGFFYTELHILILHAFYSVTGVYIICTLIDILQIRFFERPFFAFYDRLIANKKAKI